MKPFGSGDLVGDYRIIGAPGPSGAYRAVHVSLPRRVMLEVRAAELTDWRALTIQTMRASCVLDSMCHPGIARILEHGVLPDRRTWFVSELPDGIALSDIMLRRQLAKDEIAALIRDVAEVLAHAHAHDVVHGLVRPHAITFTTGTRAFPISVGEWGNLHAPDEPADDLGFGVYAAPELARGLCDGRADVFALGVLAYRAATGKFPFVPPELVPGIPGKLGALLARMLAPDRAQRPTAAEVYKELATDHGPRFATPRWTPAPYGEPREEAIDEVIALVARVRDVS